MKTPPASLAIATNQWPHTEPAVAIQQQRTLGQPPLQLVGVAELRPARHEPFTANSRGQRCAAAVLEA